MLKSELEILKIEIYFPKIIIVSIFVNNNYYLQSASFNLSQHHFSVDDADFVYTKTMINADYLLKDR